jgi:two-component system NarL family sensor kinase
MNMSRKLAEPPENAEVFPSSQFRRIRFPQMLAWILWGSTVLCVAGFLTFVYLNQLSLTRMLSEFILMGVSASVALATVGTLIVTNRPSNAVGWLFCASGLALSINVLIEQYTRYALVTAPGALPIPVGIVWLNFWTFIPIIGSVIFILPFVFPDGHLPSRRWWPAFGVTLCALLVLTVGAAFQPGPVDASLPEVNNPLGLAENHPLLQFLNAVGPVLTLISLIMTIGGLIIRVKRSVGVERLQFKWYAYGAVTLIFTLILPIVLTWPDFTQDTALSSVMLSFGFAFLPATIGVAILRYRLYDIDLLIRRTLLYGVLTMMVVGLYVLVVGYLGTIFATGPNLPISLVATGVVAVLFHPLREWLQRAINRWLYGERSEPYTVLSRLGQRLEAALEPNEVLQTIISTVKDALKLPYVAVSLAHDSDFVIAVAEGSPVVGELLHIPLSYQGISLGQLIVSARSPGELWSTAERHLLIDLAHQAGIAVHGVRVMIELQHAREQLVLAREEERRRLRRSLHDDLAPSLAGFALTTAAIQELILRDPTTAVEASRNLQKAIRTSIANVRDLVYDLRPPTLDELGLVGAIRELVGRSHIVYKADGSATDGPELQVRFEVLDTLPMLPAAVEVAAYRIVQEALINVKRHSQARSCFIQIRCPQQSTLWIEVMDDGIGLSTEQLSGVGMSSMRERAAELGGLCKIEPTVPRGTRVTAKLPVLTDSFQKAVSI